VRTSTNISSTATARACTGRSCTSPCWSSCRGVCPKAGSSASR
jgi:hypothetical protein